MNNFELRKLLTRSIKVSFPEIRDDVFFEIDRDYKEAYFAGRRCNFFREVDNDMSLNFKIRRYRNRFHISGSIQNTCLTGEVREIKVEIAMKLINLKRKKVVHYLDSQKFKKRSKFWKMESNFQKGNYTSVKLHKRIKKPN